MIVIFFLLAGLSFIGLIIGVVKPSLLTKVIKREWSRKKLAAVFGGLTVVFLIGMGATAPPSTSQPKADKEQSTQQVTETKSEEKTAEQVKEEPKAPEPLDQQIKNKINQVLGEKNNTDKPTVVEVSVTKYNASEQKAYNTDANATHLLIRINSSENLTTNLQKATMEKEAAQIFQNVFPISQDIADIIIWSQLPIKDQYGNVRDDTAIVFAMGRPLFGKVNWENYNYRDLPKLLKSEEPIDDRNGYFEKIKF